MGEGKGFLEERKRKRLYLCLQDKAHNMLVCVPIYTILIRFLKNIWISVMVFIKI